VRHALLGAGIALTIHIANFTNAHVQCQSCPARHGQQVFSAQSQPFRNLAKLIHAGCWNNSALCRPQVDFEELLRETLDKVHIRLEKAHTDFLFP
jgi:hypothetical protein